LGRTPINWSTTGASDPCPINEVGSEADVPCLRPLGVPHRWQPIEGHTMSKRSKSFASKPGVIEPPMSIPFRRPASKPDNSGASVVPASIHPQVVRAERYEPGNAPSDPPHDCVSSDGSVVKAFFVPAAAV